MTDRWSANNIQATVRSTGQVEARRRRRKSMPIAETVHNNTRLHRCI
jgi:hypothetical protein